MVCPMKRGSSSLFSQIYGNASALEPAEAEASSAV